MSKEKIDMIVEGGKAVAGPAVGQKLGPLRISIPNVLAKINEKTASFKGIKVPIKLIIDNTTKEFDVEVGTPPVSELIKNELKVPKGSGEPNKNKIANVAIEQIIKIAKMKKDSMYTTKLKSAITSVIGSCNSMGMLVEGMQGHEAVEAVNSGKFKKEIEQEITEVTKEKMDALNIQLKKVQEEIQKELAKKAAEEEAEKAELKAALGETEAKEEKVEEAVPGKEGAGAEEAKAVPGAKSVPGKEGDKKSEGVKKESKPGKPAPK